MFRRRMRGCAAFQRPTGKIGTVREDPGDPEPLELEHPPRIVDRVDRRREADGLRAGDSPPAGAAVLEADAPRAGGAADRDAEADVLDRQESRSPVARLLERAALEAEEHGVVVEQVDRSP